LAKDFLGTRQLYYTVSGDHVSWCTILDPLVIFNNRSLSFNKEFIAGWVSFFPAEHLTPYSEIAAVPASSFVCLSREKKQVTKYWNFDPAKRINARQDVDYEEHFRSVFSEAVRKRLRANSPIVAELSGGMDSSSIVCVGDSVLRRGLADTPRLDTISYYDDSE